MKVSCFKLVIWITLFMGQSNSICFRFSAFYWDSEDSIESRSGGTMTDNYAPQTPLLNGNNRRLLTLLLIA